MERIPCTVWYEDWKEGQTKKMPGVIVQCQKCGLSIRGKGDTKRAIRKCLETLKQRCLELEENDYFDAEDERR